MYNIFFAKNVFTYIKLFDTNFGVTLYAYHYYDHEKNEETNREEEVGDRSDMVKGKLP